ncbi:peptidyl-prolyl cis-trans isomerase FKBP17-1, chloroplastic-like [Papaver somniferum]|uniref:peptidyl-prolyl cis-trans isomerase FKBP17-1, chloroplastic-like n=1 Tax=Papaver somniferum TaxID=3469 RepID=UPI000E700CBB|nr:peptidyl-prolyl cis-trans isomerase FKBP17-1, chloroplastic-like [Papaver somniferum]
MVCTIYLNNMVVTVDYQIFIEQRPVLFEDGRRLQLLNSWELEDSGGVKSLDLRIGVIPMVGDQKNMKRVSIHYYGRLAAKQGWRFDSTYDHKDETGVPIPFAFIVGASDNVISGITAATKSMKVGGIRRVIIPPSQGYQNTSQEPLPPNFFDRQRLFTTIFNPTRLVRHFKGLTTIPISPAENYDNIFS